MIEQTEQAIKEYLTGNHVGEAVDNDAPPDTSGGTGVTTVVSSYDPNEKIGPSGFGAPGYVDAEQTLPYQVSFENEASATAPAQQAVVTDQLDANLDWNTFELTGIGFGSHFFALPANSRHFETTVAMSYNGQDLDVQIEAGIHADTGQVYATFQSVNPATGLPPDILTGFLPPEDGTGRGTGYVSYVIQPKAGLPTGDRNPQRGASDLRLQPGGRHGSSRSP